MKAAQLPAEQRTDRPGASTSGRYRALIAQLSHQSVTKHFDAYTDVPWDDPAYAIDPSDARWVATLDNAVGTGLASTPWFRSLPAEQQARLGLDLVASKMKIGLEFENVLKRGLLEFAATLPNGSPEFRYVYHEVIEEAQHSLMFQEFVNRSGFDATGLGAVEKLATRFIVTLGRRFPSLFFVFVLGGEDPIDYVQRQELRRGTAQGADLHPLLERIMRIHVTEEARHLSFARHYLRHHVPTLGRLRRTALGIEAPLILGVMARMMLRPSPQIVRRHAIPRATLRQVYRHPDNRAEMLASLRKVRSLCDELGLVTPVTRPVWKALGIWQSGDPLVTPDSPPAGGTARTQS
jgi:hypothetical protein